MVRLAGNRALLVALVASLTIFLTGAALGYSSIGRAWAERSLIGVPAGPRPGGLDILVQNISVLMLLYSGVLTLGLTSLLGMVMVAAFVGATMAVGVSNSGIRQLAVETAAYAPMEFAGLVVAAAAGLYPVIAMAGRVFADEARLELLGTYLRALRTSLKILACATGLIVVAAVVESVVLAVR
jgi:uncharacterized membrane protein SpoIIM required for sporulation